MAREELRINIIIKGDHVFLGAQATDCDPKMTMLQGTLQTALERIPSFVEESNTQWDAAPRNPKSAIPEPVPAPPPVNRTATTAKKTKAAEKAAPPAQPRFF